MPKNNCQKSPRPSPSTFHLILLSLATLSDPREQQVVVRAWGLESVCLQGPEELCNAQGLGVAWGGGERPCLCPWAPVSQMAPRNLRWLPTQSVPLQTLFEDWIEPLLHQTSDPDPISSSTHKSSKPLWKDRKRPRRPWRGPAALAPAETWVFSPGSVVTWALV